MIRVSKLSYNVIALKKQFEIIDHTADIGIVAYGGDLNELLKNAAIGMLSLITDLRCVEKKLVKEIVLQEQDSVALLVGWLNSLLYELDAEHLIYKDFDLVIQNGDRVKATCYGEKLDIQKHVIRREIKAATYHNLEIKNQDNIYSATIIFDI
ncbi:MAG: archease [Dehalococcoidia bacterium]